MNPIARERMVSRGSGVRATCFLWLAAVLVSSAQGPGRSAQAPVADVASLVAQMWAIPHTRAEWRAEAHLKVQIRTQMRATGAYRAVLEQASARLDDPAPTLRRRSVDLMNLAAVAANPVFLREEDEAEGNAVRAQAHALVLARLPREEDIGVQLAIASSLGALAHPGSIAPLVALSRHPGTLVAWTALDWLGRAGGRNPDLVDRILPYLETRLAEELAVLHVQDIGHVGRVIGALGLLGDRRALRSVETAVRHPDFGFQPAALRALADIAAHNRFSPPVGPGATSVDAQDRVRAEGMLREALTDATEGIRQQARAALDRLAREDERPEELERRRLDTRARNATPPPAADEADLE